MVSTSTEKNLLAICENPRLMTPAATVQVESASLNLVSQREALPSSYSGIT